MKKHWKKLLASFVVILLIAAGYVAYIFKFKEYDVADQEVTEITKETYTLELPDGTVIKLDEDGNIVESNETNVTNVTSDGQTTSTNGSDDENSRAASDSNSSTDSTSGNTSSNGSTGSDKGSTNSGSTSISTKESLSGSGSSNGGSNPTGNETTNVTVASIKEKYKPTMGSLQDQANGRINALVGRALEEYQSIKANGESVNYAYFYNKYTSAATELESRTDKVFYQVVNVIEKELAANGYSKSHAESFVNEYEAAKDARRSALLDKAMNR